MAYLLDSDTLIQAKNEYYGFDLCPGFWDWLVEQNTAGVVYSIDRIQRELLEGNDELSAWASERGPEFFLPIDAATNAAMSRVAMWVQNFNFTDRAKREFFSGNDQYLIAFALAHGHVVASHEVHNEEQRNKIKIPTVCRALGIPCVLSFQMLRDSGAQFILKR